MKNITSATPTTLFKKTAAVALTFVAALSLQAKPASEEASLKIYVNDLEGQAWSGLDNARDNLLHRAIDNVAERNDLIESYEFNYNETPEKSERDYLLITVTDWQRSRTNFYTFSATARYVDPNGKTLNLGSFSGTRTGIAVINNRDVSEQFIAAAEEAIHEAFEKLEEKTNVS